MTYKGHIESGRVVFDEPTRLPDGTRVYIEVVSVSQESEIGVPTSSLAEQLSRVIAKAEGLPDDWAEDHDRYLREEHSR